MVARGVLAVGRGLGAIAARAFPVAVAVAVSLTVSVSIPVSVAVSFAVSISLAMSVTIAVPTPSVTVSFALFVPSGWPVLGRAIAAAGAFGGLGGLAAGRCSVFFWDQGESIAVPGIGVAAGAAVAVRAVRPSAAATISFAFAVSVSATRRAMRVHGWGACATGVACLVSVVILIVAMAGAPGTVRPAVGFFMVVIGVVGAAD